MGIVVLYVPSDSILSEESVNAGHLTFLPSAALFYEF